jgi:hypothetical protein
VETKRFPWAVLITAAVVMFLVGFASSGYVYTARIRQLKESHREAVVESDRALDKLRREINELGDAGRAVLTGVESVGDRLGDVFAEVQRITDSRKRADALGRALVSEVQTLIGIIREGNEYFGVRETEAKGTADSDGDG